MYSKTNSIASDSIHWIVWRNQRSGNATVTAHATYQHNGIRTLCGRSLTNVLATHAPLANPKCHKCLTIEANEKQFAQLQSVGESAEQ